MWNKLFFDIKGYKNWYNFNGIFNMQLMIICNIHQTEIERLIFFIVSKALWVFHKNNY